MKYTKSDDAKIIEQSKTMTPREMAQYWGITENAMTKKLKRLGIYEPGKYQKTKWDKRKLKYLVDNYDKVTLATLVDKLEINQKMIREKARTLGLYNLAAVKIVREATERCSSYELNVVSEAVEAVMEARIKQDPRKISEDDIADMIYERLEWHGINGTNDLKAIIDMIKTEKVAG